MNKKRLLLKTFATVAGVLQTVSVCAQTSYTLKVGDKISYDSKTYEVTGENLITNPNFDDDYTGWKAGDGKDLSSPKFTIESKGGPDGSKCLHATTNEGQNSAGSILTGWQVKKGKKYVFSCYNWQNNGSGANTYWQVYTATSATTTTQSTPLKNLNREKNKWTLTQVIFDADQDYVVASFRWLSKNTSFDCFYLGEVQETSPLTAAKEQYEEEKYQATTTLSDASYQVITGKEKADLNAAINATPEETVDGYNNAKENITSALSTFKNALASYTNYNSQITEMVTTAKALGVDNADSYQVTITEETTAADLQEKLNAIKVAQYDKVSSCGYGLCTQKYGMDISQWTTEDDFTLTNMTDQAYAPKSLVSTYHEVNGGYYQDSWRHRITKTVTLPQGSYILKFACRSGNGEGHATVTFGDNQVSATFSPNGDKGRGINTSGATSFDDQDQYANNNEGCGWEWRYLPFTLANQEEVIFSIDLQATTQHQYPGFTDLQLFTSTLPDCHVTLDEDGINEIEGKEAIVTLKRKFAQWNWNSVVFPFKLTKEQISKVFGSGTKMAKYKGSVLKEGTTNEYILNFTSFENNQMESIEPNVPLLLRPSQIADEYIFEGVQIVEGTPIQKDSKIDFIGTYEKNGLTITDKDYFMATNSKMYQAHGGEDIKAFRAVFRLNDATSEAKTLTLSFDNNEPTAIHTNSCALNAEKFDIYNPAGQLVKKNATSIKGLAKGLYIINRKKVIIE